MTVMLDLVRQAINGTGEETEVQRGTPGRNPALAWRTAATVVGVGLLANGLRRRSLGGTLIAGVGGVLLREAIVGRGPVQEALGLQRFVAASAKPFEVRRTGTILKSPEEVYGLWRDPVALKAIFEGLADVTVIDENRLHWAMKGPLGTSLAFDTIYVDARPGERLRWRSLAGAPLLTGGSLTFRPTPNRGTEVTLVLQFAAPGGLAGTKAASLLEAVPRGIELQVLRNLKCLAEVGEVTTIKGQPACRNDGRDV